MKTTPKHIYTLQSPKDFCQSQSRKHQLESVLAKNMDKGLLQDIFKLSKFTYPTKLFQTINNIIPTVTGISGAQRGVKNEN